MHNNKYISTDNYEIIEKPNFFEVDEQIAKTISILNKKGYKTIYSCAGHNEHSCYKSSADIELLEEAQKGSNYHIGKITDKDFEYYSDAEITSTYIKFDKHYDFKDLPDGFNYETADDLKKSLSDIGLGGLKGIIYGDELDKRIYYFANDVRKADEIIAKEIADANKVLLQWAKNLPYLNN